MRKGLAVFAVALILLMASAVQAQPAIDFETTGFSTGTVSFGGGTGFLVGTDIEVDHVIGRFGAPPLLFPINDGHINFTTGSHQGGWVFGAGLPDSITIEGGIPGLSIPDDSTLLRGQLIGARINDTGTGFQVVFAGFFNVVHPDIQEAYFPILPDFYPFSGTIGLTISIQVPPGEVLEAGDAFSTDQIVSGNTPTRPTPEPSSMILLGVGAVGAFVGYRRRMKIAA
jgi:hypothetical protein